MLKSGFTKKSVGTLTLGEKLKKIRGERRISLSEVSRYTKIPIKYLEYLEERNYEKLPADVYVKGFVRNYADFLGVDEKSLIKLFEKERGIQKNMEKGKGYNGPEKTPAPISIYSFVVTPKMIIGFLVVLVSLGGFFYLYSEFGSFSDNPRLVILSPDKNYSTSNNSISVEGVTDIDAKIFINDQPVLVSDEGKFKEILTIHSGNNSINVKAVNKFGKESAENINVNSSYLEGNIDANNNNPRGDIRDVANIEIEVKVDPGPVWLSVEADDSLVFSGTMLSGSSQTFKAERKITINSGKGNATMIKFNGKDIGSLGQDPGPVRGVTFDFNTKY